MKQKQGTFSHPLTEMLAYYWAVHRSGKHVVEMLARIRAKPKVAVPAAPKSAKPD